MGNATGRGWPGVGPQLAGRLARLDIHRAQDLLLHLPLRYEDETRLTPIADLRPGLPAQIEAQVRSAEVHLGGRRQLIAHLADASGSLTARWLNFYPSLQAQLEVGARLRLFGEVREGMFGREMVHPRLRRVGTNEAQDALPESLTPVYPTTAGLAQSALRKLITRAMGQFRPQEILPDALLQPLGLPEIGAALTTLHFPPPDADAQALEARSHPAWQRVKFEELLVQQISLRRAYLARRQRHAPALDGAGELAAALCAALPFGLTGAQSRASREIAADLATPHPMQRLLQGDVGSGKTIVAALAMLRAVEAGYQAVLMAPTDLLAEQHYRKLAEWLAPLGLEIAWIAASRKKKEREAALARLAAGELQLAVGTHALIEDPVALPRLALAVIDEQHRFGVRQRLTLRDKGVAGWVPHLLMMSATPIPRTLAMSHYADLDVSVLDELPPGRSPVITRLVSSGRRPEVIRAVRETCLRGGQAYWVCPLIEESETLQLQTAVDTCEMLRAELPELAVGLLHGRLKADEKSATMADFVANRVQLLVATTVIEVGVDVPNASLMVIEHAERFGLAQLHQLRGRVGRGSAHSACILLYAQPLSQTGRARLKVIHQHSDGFEIAREDLAIRGPGEFVGARQSGLPMLRFADLSTDAELLAHARVVAETLLHQHPAIADQLIERWLAGRSGLLQA